MIVKLLTDHHLEFLSLTGGCTGSSESTHVEMPHCWKSHALAQLLLLNCRMHWPILLRNGTNVPNMTIICHFKHEAKSPHHEIWVREQSYILGRQLRCLYTHANKKKATPIHGLC